MLLRDVEHIAIELVLINCNRLEGSSISQAGPVNGLGRSSCRSRGGGRNVKRLVVGMRTVFTLGGSTVDANWLASVATALGVVIVGVSAFLGYGQLREYTRTRRAAVLSEVISELSTHEMLAARGKILAHELPNPGQETDEQRDLQFWVAAAFDKVAFIAREGLIPTEYVLALYHPAIIEMWEHLEPWVLHVRESRQHMKRFQHHFEWLYKQARDRDPGMRFMSRRRT